MANIEFEIPILINDFKELIHIFNFLTVYLSECNVADHDLHLLLGMVGGKIEDLQDEIGRVTKCLEGVLGK